MNAAGPDRGRTEGYSGEMLQTLSGSVASTYKPFKPSSLHNSLESL